MTPHISQRIAAIRAKVRTSTANQQRRQRYAIHFDTSGGATVSDWQTGRTRYIHPSKDLEAMGRNPTQFELSQMFK